VLPSAKPQHNLLLPLLWFLRSWTTCSTCLPLQPGGSPLQLFLKMFAPLMMNLTPRQVYLTHNVVRSSWATRVFCVLSMNNTRVLCPHYEQQVSSVSSAWATRVFCVLSWVFAPSRWSNKCLVLKINSPAARWNARDWRRSYVSNKIRTLTSGEQSSSGDFDYDIIDIDDRIELLTSNTLSQP